MTIKNPRRLSQNTANGTESADAHRSRKMGTTLTEDPQCADFESRKQNRRTATRGQFLLIGAANAEPAPMGVSHGFRGFTVTDVQLIDGVPVRFAGVWRTSYGIAAQHVGEVVVQLAEPSSTRLDEAASSAESSVRVCVSIATSAGWRTVADIARAGPDWPFLTAVLAVIAGAPRAR